MNFERYIGLSWRTGGRDVSTGVDCWGLLRLFYLLELRINLSEHAANPGQLASQPEVAASELGTDGQWVRTEEPRPGDGVALGVDGVFSHVGVFVVIKDQPAILHIRLKQTSCILLIRRLMSEGGFNTVEYFRHAANSVR